MGTAKENKTDALHGQKEFNTNLPLYLLLQLAGINLLTGPTAIRLVIATCLN